MKWQVYVLPFAGIIKGKPFTLCEQNPEMKDLPRGKRANIGSQLAKKIKKYGGRYKGLIFAGKDNLGVQLYSYIGN